MSLRDYIATGPVLSKSKAKAFLSEARAPIEYLTEKRWVDLPTLPFQLFGLRYEEDIVIESNHPDWSMHEYARVRVDGRDVWIAKDSDYSGLQTVTSGLDCLKQWVPEAPVPRHSSPVEVIDRSTDTRLDVCLKYKNPKGQNVEVEFSSPRSPANCKKRNGSTFNHSSNSVSAVLNISKNQMWGVKAEIKFDGKTFAIKKIFGLIPVRALLEQSQGGVAIASMKVSKIDRDRFEVQRPISGDAWNTEANEVWRWSGNSQFTGEAQYSDKVSQWVYRFENGEFAGAQVFGLGREVAITGLRLSAPLPDFAREFKGEVVRRFIIELEGEIHGLGEIKCRSKGAGDVEIDFLPQKPYWFSSRPMRTSLRIAGPTGLEIRTIRI